VRGVTHEPDAALGVAAAQADDAREEPGQRAGARQPVVVHAEAEITVGARRVRGEQAAIDIAHRLRIFRRAVSMPVLFALAGAITERRRQPEVVRVPRRPPRACQRDPEQRIDALQREIRRVLCLGPPDVGARLEDDGRGISGVARGEAGEILGRTREIAAVQRVESGTQRAEWIGRTGEARPRQLGRNSLQR